MTPPGFKCEVGQPHSPVSTWPNSLRSTLKVPLSVKDGLWSGERGQASECD